ncbi:membrane protein [Candidatus Magnetomorum sp. HK-1]|nr:membrane protein [Candidatus Magnetomorum sp. HK-1]
MPLDKKYIKQDSNTDNLRNKLLENDDSKQKYEPKRPSLPILKKVSKIDREQTKVNQKSKKTSEKTTNYNNLPISHKKLLLKLDENELNQVNKIIEKIESKKQRIQYTENPIPFRAPYPPLTIVWLSVLFSILMIFTIYSSTLLQKISIYYCLHERWIFILAALTCILLLFAFKGIHSYLTKIVGFYLFLTFSGVLLTLFVRFEIIPKQYSLYVGTIILTAFTASLPLLVRAFGATRYLFIGGPKFQKKFFYPIVVFLSIGLLSFCIFAYDCKQMEKKSRSLFSYNAISLKSLITELETSEELEEIEKDLRHIKFWVKEFYAPSMIRFQNKYVNNIIKLLNSEPDLCDISDTQLCTFNHKKSNPRLWQKLVEKGKNIHTFVQVYKPILLPLTKKNRQIIQNKIDQWLDSPFLTAKAFFLSDLLHPTYIDSDVRKDSYLVTTLVQDKIKITDGKQQIHYVNVFDPKILRGNTIMNNTNSKLSGNSFNQTTNWESLILFSMHPYSDVPPPHSILIVRRVKRANQVWLIFSTPELEKTFTDALKYNQKIVSSKSFPSREENICGNGFAKDIYDLEDGSKISIKRCYTSKLKNRVIVITLINRM